MPYPISKLWNLALENQKMDLDHCLTKALAAAGSQDPIPVFFRADDVAVPGKQFRELVDLFSRYQVPLSMSVVPAWLTGVRWKGIERLCNKAPNLWCFYQHGWRHMNHETTGKKQEFGPARPRAAIEHDLVCGRERLTSLMQDVFFPAFTPPWNRCSLEALDVLTTSNCRAISRSRGASPPAPVGMPDFQINVDLHTRPEPTPALGWKNLYAELATGIADGFCGIMIHHQRMNDNALAFLEGLLERMMAMDAFRFYHLKDLTEAHHEA
ncbi:MAG: polysaccharide deacetylase [Deltaproteobacteria bacterium]|nr:polysaccharide deacetylase [Deltaproteobacteria bacterium]